MRCGICTRVSFVVLFLVAVMVGTGAAIGAPAPDTEGLQTDDSNSPAGGESAGEPAESANERGGTAAGATAAEPAAERVGDLGAADRLIVRGLETTLAASLRQGLLDDGDLYWLGIPTADRRASLTALRTRIPLALEAAGFREPRVTVDVGPGPRGQESVLVDVVAGPRLMAGPIRVTGIPDDMAARLVRYLQEPQPPGGAVPETIRLPDGTEKVLWFDAEGNGAKLGTPAWTPGKPAPFGERCASGHLMSVAGFFRGEGYLAIDGWKHPWEAGYLDAIREHVDVEVQSEGERAVLAIDVRRLPKRTTLAGIEVNDGLRTTPADLLAYLGLTLGQPVTGADRQAWLGRLRLSGRFIKQACRFEPRAGGCVARFELVEYKRAEPLDRAATPEQQALLRARAWLVGEWHAGREIHFKATVQLDGKAGGPGRRRIELITGRETGGVVKVEGGDWSCAAACVQGMTGLFTDRSRFEGALPAGWVPSLTVGAVIEEEGPNQRLHSKVGVASGSGCLLQIEPVCCNAEGLTSRRDGDDLVIEIDDADGHREIRLDAASGRPRLLVSVGESGRAELAVEAGSGLVAAAIATLRERAGENLADASRPVSSAVRFALANRGPVADAMRLVARMTPGIDMDDDAIAQWLQSLQKTVDDDGFAAVDAIAMKSLGGLLDAVATDAPKSLAIPASQDEGMALVRSLLASGTASMTARIDGVAIARAAADDQNRPALLTRYSREPLIGREPGRAVAAAAAPVLRRLEQNVGRDSALVATARAAVLVVCKANDATAARELARVPATSLWTPELETLCAALGPRGRDLDRRAREALAFLHGSVGDRAWSVATYRQLLAEVEERHGPNHPEAAKHQHNLVWLLNQTGAVAEAYALSRRPRVAIEHNVGASATGLHLPAPARYKQPKAVAKADDGKKSNGAKKTTDDAGNSGAARSTGFERWGGLNLDPLETLR